MPEFPSLYVLVPRFSWESPVMGMAALCNAVVEYTPVSLVTLKPGGPEGPALDPRVRKVSLGEHPSWWQRRRAYMAELRKARSSARPFSLSIGFSGDIFNATMRRHARTVASLRNNPFQDYRFLAGARGTLAAHLHMVALRRHDVVLSMSKSMDDLLSNHGIKQVARVPNFIDEDQFEPGRPAPAPGQPLRLLVMGQLIARKRIDLAIDCIKRLTERGIDAQLDILGGGPLRAELEAQAQSAGLQTRVHFHGYVRDRHRFLLAADALLQPSESEGVSRSIMEALYCGVPCVLRGGEAGEELVTDSENGAVFASDADFVDAVMRVSPLARQLAQRERIPPLLPSQFRRAAAIAEFLAVLRM